MRKPVPAALSPASPAVTAAAPRYSQGSAPAWYRLSTSAFAAGLSSATAATKKN